MKYTMLTVLLLSLFGVSVSVIAETPTNTGPELIILNMGDRELPFKHRNHQEIVNNECQQCHASKIGKIDDWNKGTAHMLCITCHELKDKGPTECRECHTVYSRK